MRVPLGESISSIRDMNTARVLHRVMAIVLLLWWADENAEFAFSQKSAAGPRAHAQLDRTGWPWVDFARLGLTSRGVACTSIVSTSRAVG